MPASDYHNLPSNEGEGGNPFEHENPELGETSIETFLKKALIERQIITQELLLECLEERNRRDPPPPLASVLLRKGYLNDEQLEDLLRVLSSRRQAGGKDESIALGEGAVKKGLTTNAEILSALEIQEREGQKGTKPRLGEVLVRRGTLTVAQVKKMLEKQGRTILKCSGCGNQYNVHDYSPDKRYTCLNCGGKLTDSGPIDTLNVEGTAPDRSQALESLDDMFIGKRVGPCEITDKIGEGGMGAVYKAQHIALNKTVAVKIMSPAVMGEAHKKRFLREARTAASLEHPNIVIVHDTGEESGFPYIVMQYIEGKSLAEILWKKGKLTTKQALRIVIATANALAAAHEKNLIHRDIKPDNIMITTKGEIKVTDFGLAKSVHKEDMTITAAGTVMGTPAYMSPEQFEGKLVDARSDIYSLGVTLYRTLAGEAPFAGDTLLELWQSHLNDPPPPLDDDLPPELCEIIYKMLEKDPAQRYQSAVELISDMREVYLELGGEDESEDYLLLMDSGTVAGKAAKRGKITRIAAFGVIAVALIVALALFFGRKSSEVTHPTAKEMEVFNAARLNADKLAAKKKYMAALGVWGDFKGENPEDFWHGLVEKEREHILQIADVNMRSMLEETDNLTSDGNLKMAKDKCGEILTMAQEMKEKTPTPGTEEILRETSQKLAAIKELISQQAGKQPEVNQEKMAEWQKAKELVQQQLGRKKFASARLTCLPFTSSDYPTEIRGEAEQKLVEISAKEEEHKTLLAAEEKVRFEQDMLDARHYLKLGNYDKARKTLHQYLEHDNKEFKRAAQQILSEVRSAETFTSAMAEVDALRTQRNFEKALLTCNRYIDSSNLAWARIAREKLLQVKKERFLGKNLLYVQGGRFSIGSKDPADSNPLREVSLRPFYIGKFEVTNAEYQRFVKATGHRAPDNWPTGKPGNDQINQPVTLITVKDASAYCAYLTKKEGVKYRLPTEAEWEIAASWDGQKKLTYPWGEKFRKDICNIGGKLLTVGQCQGDLSPTGAYDMAGNVCELTTATDNKGYVIRGGCFDDAGDRRSARATYRQSCDKSTTGSSIGFRIVRED